MSESNLSKCNLEELCRAVGVSTEGVKADLWGNCDVDEHEDHVEGVDEFDIDPVAKSLKELVYKSKEKFKQLPVPMFQNDVEDPDNTHIHSEECTNQN
ncbi:5148_t:CDS:2 [Cetraspora pellucida]|uniref:5148_t:CDS:1 n=1 Tax=Cetraspora pellucida TaxID=1433469 RepID=A0ACA9PFJ6_9GLOM|nr:5148_t:CDS:2 [Cetraspora pellucida]